MRIYVDLDNTLCKTEGTNYEQAKPIQERIDKINSLYNMGHQITIYTARGSNKCFLYYFTKLTEQQLKEWGILYHYLSIGEKPVYDVLVDDRNICLDELDRPNFLDRFYN